MASIPNQGWLEVPAHQCFVIDSRQGSNIRLDYWNFLVLRTKFWNYWHYHNCLHHQWHVKHTVYVQKVDMPLTSNQVSALANHYSTVSYMDKQADKLQYLECPIPLVDIKQHFIRDNCVTEMVKWIRIASRHFANHPTGKLIIINSDVNMQRLNHWREGTLLYYFHWHLNAKTTCIRFTAEAYRNMLIKGAPSNKGAPLYSPQWPK